MLNLENISDKAADYISCSLQMNSEKKSVMAYGIFGFLQVIVSILIVVILGLLFKVLAEALIISFSIVILRKYSGGAHASTSGNCLVVGTTVTIIPAVIINYLDINLSIVVIIGLFVFCWSFYQIYTKAPVDSIKKPINNTKKKKRLKRSSLVVLGLYSVIISLLLSVYYSGDYSNFIRYATSIIYGTAWQVFTLTKPGHLMLSFIDNHILLTK